MTDFIDLPPPYSEPKRVSELATRKPNRFKISLDQATRYAGASGDRNPIHLDPEVARADNGVPKGGWYTGPRDTLRAGGV